MSMYEDFADSFAVHAEHSAYNAHYDRPAVLSLLGDVAGCRILDVGCGSGLYAAELVQRGADVVGFDSSATLVHRARQQVGSVADLRVHDLRDPLDWLADETIDRAVMALVLHHLDDTWNTGWKVRFRRAPLTAWCTEFSEAGFLIERLVEPLPAESMKDRFPDTYDKLTVEPFFIVFVLVKRSTPAARQARN